MYVQKKTTWKGCFLHQDLLKSLNCISCSLAMDWINFFSRAKSTWINQSDIILVGNGSTGFGMLGLKTGPFFYVLSN